MWPFSDSKNSGRQLHEVLRDTKGLVERSEQTIWEGLSPAEVAMDLGIAISQIEKSESVDARHLKMLFAPTGPIQESALASGWTDDYMRLSSEFDSLIDERA
jgi:hypothetical protein